MAEKEKLQHIDFESFLAEISSHFINLSTDEIDNHIEAAQKKVCKFLNFDLATLWQRDGTRFHLSHIYMPPGTMERPNFYDGEKVFPWSYKQIIAGKIIALSTEELPEEAAGERDFRRALGIKSFVIIPLVIADRVYGAATFINLQKEHVYSPVILRRLQLVSQIFGNAILRKEFAKHLHENEMRQKMAIDSAGVGIWEYDCKGGHYHFTEQACKLLNFETNERISMQGFLGAIHDEDMPIVLESITTALTKQNPIDQVFRVKDRTSGIKWICARGTPLSGADGEIQRLTGIYLDITVQKLLEQELREHMEQVESLKAQLEGDDYFLRELHTDKGFEQIVGSSRPVKKMLLACRQVAATDATILILGETGTGKGLLATEIHRMSPFKDRPFITVNCAALPANLMESELFGREKGAFTGAHARQAGRFELANNGTIFLDEIGEIPLDLQAKLLRVLQEGEFERLGGTTTIKVRARVIAATARDLAEEVRKGHFRQDLFYRLNVFPIEVPPLRQRTEDIAGLLQHFIAKYNKKFAKEVVKISRSTLYKLMNYEWPGNVRELEHLVERGVIVSTGSSFTLGNSLNKAPSAKAPGNSEQDLASIERNHITQVLRDTGWKIEGPNGAASILNLNPSTLRFRIKKLGIVRPV